MLSKMKDLVMFSFDGNLKFLHGLLQDCCRHSASHNSPKSASCGAGTRSKGGVISVDSLASWGNSATGIRLRSWSQMRQRASLSNHA